LKCTDLLPDRRPDAPELRRRKRRRHLGVELLRHVVELVLNEQLQDAFAVSGRRSVLRMAAGAKDTAQAGNEQHTAGNAKRVHEHEV
jgi:hypothetical protein